MSSSYEPIPTTYPPSSTGALDQPSLTRFLPFLRNDRLPTHTHTTPGKVGIHRFSFVQALKYLLGSCLALIILHYVYIGAFPYSRYAHKFRHSTWSDITYDFGSTLGLGTPVGGIQGIFFRDSYPIKTIVEFHQLAIQEIAAIGLDTCDDKIGLRFIESYSNSVIPYCLPRASTDESFQFINTSSHHHHSLLTQLERTPDTKIWCTPNHHDAFTQWWPYPNSPCLATNLRTINNEARLFEASGCALTEEGQDLLSEIGKERFLGSDLRFGGEVCKELLDRTVLVIGRQDQWNPFHVAEDLITTVVTVLIAARTVPDLMQSRVQLVFNEGFGMDSNHFTALWDRIGAWAPRRLHLDPWGEGVCLTNSIHSIGAGASLLSAMGVGQSFQCASSITWAASHYYRHLFGLVPHPPIERKPINVLWLSRAKLDAFAQKENDWSAWRDIRHINNEPELIERLRQGLSGFCEAVGCTFEDAQDVPEGWSSSSTTDLTVRFATLDPMVHALETQIHYVGHSTILVSSHGGALGLSLFLPPGQATVLELQVPGVHGNYHFEHMAYEMGQGYEMVEIDRDVDVDHVWRVVESWVDRSID